MIELRLFQPKYTLDHARNGVQPSRQQIGPAAWEVFAPPIMQYRAKEKINGAVQWSEWISVEVVREGDDDGPIPPDA